MKSHTPPVEFKLPSHRNHLSFAFQKEFLSSLSRQINAELRACLNQNNPHLNADLLTLNHISAALQQDQKLENKENSNHVQTMTFNLAQAVSNELQQQTIYFINKIDSKQCEENNTGIIKHLANLKIILLQAQELLIRIHSEVKEISKPAKNLKNTLKKLISFCNKKVDFLNLAIDSKIYRVHVPLENYKNIKKKSEKFLYEGRARGVILKTAASVTAIPFVAMDLHPVSLFADFIRSWRRRQNLFFSHSRVTFKILSTYGHACKESISNAWIAGVVDNNNVLTLPNSHFSGNTNGCKVIYVIDAKPCQMVFENGLDFKTENKIENPNGKLIFFHSLNDAVRCVDKFENGRKYHPLAGWRLHNNWQDKELKQVCEFEPQVKNLVITSLDELNHVPRDVSNIVCSYLFKPTNKLDDKKIEATEEGDMLIGPRLPGIWD